MNTGAGGIHCVHEEYRHLIRWCTGWPAGSLESDGDPKTMSLEAVALAMAFLFSWSIAVRQSVSGSKQFKRLRKIEAILLSFKNSFVKYC